MTEKLILSALILAALFSFFRPIWNVVRLVGKAKGKLDNEPLGFRIRRFVSEVCFQSKVIGERPVPGFLHALVFWGFLAFGLETVDHFFRGYGGTFLDHGRVHDLFRVFVAFFAGLVLIGILGLAFRRFVLRPESLGKFSGTSLAVAAFITTLMVTYLLDFCGAFPEGDGRARINWWIHTVVILAFLWLIPKSKHFHLALSPFTVFWKDPRIGRIRPLNFEKEEFGAEKFIDLPKHAVLSAFTCVECGRCRDHCPANGTGKVLNPKQFMLDLRRGLNTKPEGQVVGEFFAAEPLWQCTTCGACSNQCPVGIDHVSPILELRRGQNASGAFPQPMINLFKGLENAENPWSYPRQEAEDFLAERKVPAFEGQEILYWMGCMARYDLSYRKVAKAFMDLLNASGVRFGVLKQESCTGDAARRAGNEFLFQQLAEKNIALLKEAKPKTIVSTCPHCLVTLEEYKDLGLAGETRIVHHSELLRSLLQAGRLRPASNGKEPVAYHDACYLSRYRLPGGSENPRFVLEAAGREIVEPRRTRTNSFCCGAGGAMLFAEETQGKRINHERVDELLASRASAIATSCPFCRVMLSDAARDRGREGVRVLDLAEILTSAA
ncbi:MAG: (Fe-S)-binding protein [Pseudomonadota bacterium]